MKKILFASLMLTFSGSIIAQNIQLKKGQIITSQTDTKSDVDMMMGTMKNDVSMKSKLIVIEENREGYLIKRIIETLKANADGMGQNMQFDSEKAEDRKSEIGQMMAKQLEHIDTFSLDRMTGSVKSMNKVKSEVEGGMMMMSNMGGDETQGVSDAFLIVPAGAKSGTSWTDSMSINRLKTKRSFMVVEISNNIASIEMNTSIQGTTESEVQGMSMNVTINSRVNSSIRVDLNNGLILSNKNSGDINSDMEMMGQNMQVTSKTSGLTINTIQ
jgi:hypothetical protein